MCPQVRRQAQASDSHKGPVQAASGIFGLPTAQINGQNGGSKDGGTPADVNRAECVEVGGAMVKIAHLSGSEMLQLVMTEVRAC